MSFSIAHVTVSKNWWKQHWPEPVVWLTPSCLSLHCQIALRRTLLLLCQHSDATAVHEHETITNVKLHTRYPVAVGPLKMIELRILDQRKMYICADYAFYLCCIYYLFVYLFKQQRYVWLPTGWTQAIYSWQWIKTTKLTLLLCCSETQ